MNGIKVFLDIVIGTTAMGRIVFELFSDITPKTSENFRGLCTGEYGQGKISKKKLYFKGSRMHRIVDDQFIQGGDFIYGNGSGGESIYGEKFKDENFLRRHACAGLLSMANKGRNSNSSQFFITLKPCPHLDGKHVVFGQVIEGMDIVRQMAKIPTDQNERPRIKIIIFDCGDFDTRRQHLIEDPFKETMQAIYKDREKVEKVKILGPGEADDYKKVKQRSAFNIIQEYEDDELNNSNSNSNNNNIVLDQEKEIDLKDTGENNNSSSSENSESDSENNIPLLNNIKSKLGENGMKTYMELKAKINESKNLNMKAVQEENFKSQDPNWETKKLKEEYNKSREEIKEKLLNIGIPEDKMYSLNSIGKSEMYSHKK